MGRGIFFLVDVFLLGVNYRERVEKAGERAREKERNRNRERERE